MQKAGQRQEHKKSPERLSGLTVRILAVNVIAIMILGLGILYLGRYTETLIKNELESFQAETRLYAGVIAEGASGRTAPGHSVLSPDDEQIQPDIARRLVRRLGEPGTSRIRLFSGSGDLIADSKALYGSDRIIQIEKVGNLRSETGFDAAFKNSVTRVLEFIPLQISLPQFPEKDAAEPLDFPDSSRALQGEESASAWFREDKKILKRIVLSAAAPIRVKNEIVGTVLLIKDGQELETAINDVRIDVFIVFLGSLGITVLLSIYLSGLIGRPLQRLAAAAESIRSGKGRQINIPDLSARRDEIGDLSLALQDMTRALWDRMDAIEHFAADVAHEIKNPLTSLRSAVETAARIDDEKDRKKLMDIIQHDVRRLDRLISDISNASRLDAELSREEMGDVDLGVLLRRLCDAHKQPIERIGNGSACGKETAAHADTATPTIALELPKGKSALHVHGIEPRLGQVFGNLISNALSFSPQRGTVRVAATTNATSVTVAVTDEGPGIPDNNLEKIFERFYTDRPKRESYGDHSGLGLSIVRQIVTTHGGKIWAENIKDGSGKTTGARFIVQLQKAK